MSAANTIESNQTCKSKQTTGSDKIIRIATRKSPLALWQACYVKQRLLVCHPDYHIELIPLVTAGDIILDMPLTKSGGKGLFVTELERALLENRADIAVHSMKDVPGSFPEGLGLAAICQRDDPRDAFVSRHHQHLNHLAAGSVVGTSSLRRQCQLRACRPDLIIHDLRGNVGTRLAKLDQGEYDAIILATAGLKRLGLEERMGYPLSIEEFLPAPGQGAIGIECRLDNSMLRQLLLVLNDPVTEICVCAERAMNMYLGGGCQLPVGSYGELKGHHLRLRALVGTPDGRLIIRGERTGHAVDAGKTGIELAEELLSRGARDILNAVCQRDTHR